MAGFLQDMVREEWDRVDEETLVDRVGDEDGVHEATCVDGVCPGSGVVTGVGAGHCCGRDVRDEGFVFTMGTMVEGQ